MLELGPEQIPDGLEDLEAESRDALPLLCQSHDANLTSIKTNVQHSHDKHRCDVQQNPPCHVMLISLPSNALMTSTDCDVQQDSPPCAHHRPNINHMMLISLPSKPLTTSADAMCNKPFHSPKGSCDANLTLSKSMFSTPKTSANAICNKTSIP
ncbi:hypothetical protein M430DRAFT_183508 [Amorphotheca resinae ATCC 22711]|uniref:Uncharacterized protein n=1 Tax=Amorphotheca resinae ATCC 22711 TaxID=857342 RepID=A0A2T3AS19_AMORE|nr:hypothetical protein M430DRAFT_183508 [Amorphotheca resinae ATCC 22711]PSS09148.1 hypothetical protein M430DRAFT_183508 [Amorphotheca resinae ATCC 22711]